MIDQMRQRDWATRSVRSRARSLTTITEELTRALQRHPTEGELAAASGMSESEVRAIAQGTDRATLLSLDPLATDDEGLGAGLTDSSPRPDEALLAAERIGYLRDAIAELPERTRRVVAGYYLENKQLTELAEELGVTQSRASQLRSEGLELMKEALTALLSDDARAGAGATTAGSDGVKARRREAYVAAVAHRSTVRDRSDVQAYLDGAARAPVITGATITIDSAASLSSAGGNDTHRDAGGGRGGGGLHPLGA
jgi:RNA polymerase sigma factor for flagellar operon FliA